MEAKMKRHVHWWDGWKDEEDSAEEEDVEASEDELEEDDTYDFEKYQEEKIMRLKEENFLLTDQLYFIEDTLARILEVETSRHLREKELMEILNGAKVNKGKLDDIPVDRHVEMENLIITLEDHHSNMQAKIFSLQEDLQNASLREAKLQTKLKDVEEKLLNTQVEVMAEEGEDLCAENFIEEYEPMELDDEVQDERSFDQIMIDARGATSVNKKLRDHDTDDDADCRPWRRQCVEPPISDQIEDNEPRDVAGEFSQTKSGLGLVLDCSQVVAEMEVDLIEGRFTKEAEYEENGGNDMVSEVFGHPGEFATKFVSQDKENITLQKVPVKMGIEKRYDAEEPIQGWRIRADEVLEATRPAGSIAFVQKTTEGCEERVLHISVPAIGDQHSGFYGAIESPSPTQDALLRVHPKIIKDMETRKDANDIIDTPLIVPNNQDWRLGAASIFEFVFVFAQLECEKSRIVINMEGQRTTPPVVSYTRNEARLVEEKRSEEDKPTWLSFLQRLYFAIP
ncbi:uncharacterized protein LOC131856125 [Cryptomeria japonica]|uniref:uncharacterized protein LOC131856125 n=1 Tax=Cryptomeria japonica TaxID=3369 RepID=UPI0027DAAF56|nr:uncharacterized protein LOC131856125 [Cryptomeria japonica]